MDPGGKANLYSNVTVTAPPPKKLPLNLRVCFVNFLRYRNESRFFITKIVYVMIGTGKSARGASVGRLSLKFVSTRFFCS